MYEQIRKNNVDSLNQLKKSNKVTVCNPCGKGPRVMFAGNSITLHDPSKSHGWENKCGMAASAPEKDYVHIVMNGISKSNADAVYCICQVSQWERDYKNGSKYYKLYADARDFKADIIIARFVENCPIEEFDGEEFRRCYTEFIDYLNGSGRAKIILTSGFWKHPGNNEIMYIAQNRQYPFVDMSDLGECDDMKALGRYEHSGVANHPGDKGMRAIADRILEKLEITELF